VAKRSPILGYNHNVRYRGLVFHVQTEDSGVLSPHLFTHLFHTGVIVSTRKLVYDSGSAEEAIKSLMQAQHKAVLKDLRRGTFDDKIDEYLGTTPGLLPRGGAGDAEDRESQPRLARSSEPELAAVDVLGTSEQPVFVDDSGTTRRDDQTIRHEPTIPDARRPGTQPATPRTQTAERKSPPGHLRAPTPVPVEGPTSLDDLGTVDAAISATNFATIRTPIPNEFAAAQARAIEDSIPEIEIQLELDEPDDALPRTRTARDTDIAPNRMGLDDHTRPTIDVSSLSDGIPGAHTASPSANARQPGESIPPLPPPPSERHRPPSAVGAATLPPARPITRPPARPAITPPQVLLRPIPSDDPRKRSESDAVEVYAPAPPSADAPPGMERPGQYSQHKKVSQRIPIEPPSRERTGSIPIPPGLGRPGRTQYPSGSIPRVVAREPSPAPQIVRPDPPTMPTDPRPRTPTPARMASPASSRTGSPSSGSGGVVMTRPAVIVGAPAKPAPPRVRKAREDEGRGFGQGLISEKSLDEVILAYLSEDADDK